MEEILSVAEVIRMLVSAVLGGLIGFLFAKERYKLSEYTKSKLEEMLRKTRDVSKGDRLQNVPKRHVP